MKKRFILSLLFILLLVGCNNINQNTTTSSDEVLPTSTQIIDDLEAPEEITIFAINNFDKVMVVGGVSQQLDIITNPDDASQSVVWTSSDENIAKVSEDGIVTAIGEGNVTIYAISTKNLDVKGEYTIKIYDDNASTNTIEETKNYLNSIIPDELNNDLELPTIHKEGLVRIAWTSSNSDALNILGSFNRQEEDVIVTLSCKLTSGRIVDYWSKEITIKSINSVVREDLSNKPAVFMYLADSGFSNYRDGDLDGIDVINYSFARINTTTHEITLSGLKNYATVIKARNYGVRVVLSVGGWSCDGFSNACATEQTREIFVNSIIDAIVSYKFDGVDIDWEYPTSIEAGFAASSADRDNFTTIIKMLRERLDAIDEKLLLTAALSGGTPTKVSKFYDVKKIAPYLDYVHLMTYSMSLQDTYHNSALYSSTKTRPSNPVSIDSICSNYIEMGFKHKQIVIGIPFFGVVSKTKDDGSANDGIGASVVSGSSSEVSYKVIARNYFDTNIYKQYFDNVAKASYLYGNNTFVSYENGNAIDAKCLYVKSKGYGGIMVWEYNQDDNNSTLTKRIMFNMK